MSYILTMVSEIPIKPANESNCHLNHTGHSPGVLLYIKSSLKYTPFNQANKHINKDIYIYIYIYISGYDHSLRLEIVRSAIGAYDKMIEADEKQERPLYRKREWRRKERRKEKDAKRNKWHKKGGYSSVLFVAATPQSELRNKMQKEVDTTKFKIKVIEVWKETH